MKPERKPDLRARQEQLLRRYEYAEQFRNRRRRPFWFYLLIYSIGFSAPVVALMFHPGGIGGFWWPVMVVGILLASYYTWMNAAPFCPNCKRNIVWTKAVHCHVCGEPLKGSRCDRCGVNQSWTLIFGSMNNTGNRQRVSYCPACGAWLDSQCYRWLGGGSSSG